jgi:hypothetical protein
MSNCCLLLTKTGRVRFASGMDQKYGSSGEIPKPYQMMSKNYEILGQASRHTGEDLHKFWAQTDQLRSARIDRTRPVCRPDVSGMTAQKTTLSGKIDFDPKLDQINSSYNQILHTRSQGSGEAISRRSSPNLVGIERNRRKSPHLGFLLQQEKSSPICELVRFQVISSGGNNPLTS